MPVDSELAEEYKELPEMFCCGFKDNDHQMSKDEDPLPQSDETNEDTFTSQEDPTELSNNVINGNKFNKEELLKQRLIHVRPKAFSDDNPIQLRHNRLCEPYKWRRIIGFEVSGNELKNAIFPRKLRKKFRFAQAKTKLNQIYSYFSVNILECELDSHICIGVARKDFPSTSGLGIGLGSIGYYADSGRILCPHNDVNQGVDFNKGDIIGCGIVFPPHYKCYTDLSTDDSSDGMTDVVLSSLLNVNKKSMDFVQDVLGLRLNNSDSSSDDENFAASRFYKDEKNCEETDYFNENYVESRTKVEIYFTHNMKIMGKVSTYVPIGGLYPTLQVSSSGNIKLSFDFS